MKTVWISVVASVGVVGALVEGGLALSRGAGSSWRITPDLSRVHEELSSLRVEIHGLGDQIRALETTQLSLARAVGTPGREDPEPSGDPEGSLTVASVPEPGDLTEYVAAVISEERKLQEAERQRQQKERRERAEERRRELEAMRQGPYDRYNLKVNSLAKLVGMSESQKQAYFELASSHKSKLEDGMKQLREARKPEGEDAGVGQRKGRRPDGVDRDKFRELYVDLEKSFNAGMQTILSADQLATFNGLSRSAQSFQSLDLVSASGEGDNRPDASRGFPGGAGGFGAGRGPPGARPGR